MRIHLLRTKDFKSSELRKIYDLLSPHMGPLQFRMCNTALLFDKNDFEWGEFFRALGVYRAHHEIPEDDFLIAITSLRNNENWFGAPDPEGSRSAFVSGNDWEYYIYADPIFPIAYEIIANFLHRFMFQSADELLGPNVHIFPRGCVNDLCAWKAQVTFKLRTADICQDCINVLYERLPDIAILPQVIGIFESLRRQMLFSGFDRRLPELEDRVPFPVALTRRKLGMTQHSYSKLQLLLQHFDSIVRSIVVIFGHVAIAANEIDRFFFENGLTGHPSLGHWVLAIKKISTRKFDNDNGFDLPDDTSQILAQVHGIYESNSIVNLRNDTSHGYMELNEQMYMQIFESKISILEKLESLIYPLLKRFFYFQIVSTEILENSKYNFRVLDFSGSNPSFLERIVQVKFEEAVSIPISRAIYLVSYNNKKWIKLDPYWRFRVCPICNHPRLLVSDGENYLDPLVGHRVNCPDENPQ